MTVPRQSFCRSNLTINNSLYLLKETLCQSLAGEWGLSLQPNFQKGGFDRNSWKEEESDFFQGGEGLKFLNKKNKIKSEIFNNKSL